MNLNPAALAALAKGDLSNFAIAATPGGIEAQEAAGQRDMASSFKTLPKDMDDSVARQFGFKYLTGGGGDDLFSPVEAPAGWSIRPTEHSMHSDILDDKGRVRGAIFYKAAFYDRRADGYWSTRYQVRPKHDDAWETVAQEAIDTATGDVLFTAAVPTEGPSKAWERRNEADAAARAFLAKRFPKWMKPTEYWD